MNKPFSESDFATPKVTTGPIAGSRKAYTAPQAAPDLRVPRREIALTEAAGEPPVPVYDARAGRVGARARRDRGI